MPGAGINRRALPHFRAAVLSPYLQRALASAIVLVVGKTQVPFLTGTLPLVRRWGSGASS